MTTTFLRNNLPPEAQGWVTQVQRAIQRNESEISSLRKDNDNLKSRLGVANSRLGAITQTVGVPYVLQESDEDGTIFNIDISSTSLYTNAEIIVPLNATRMVGSLTGSVSAYNTSAQDPDLWCAPFVSFTTDTPSPNPDDFIGLTGKAELRSSTAATAVGIAGIDVDVSEYNDGVTPIYVGVFSYLSGPGVAVSLTANANVLGNIMFLSETANT